MIPTKHGLTLKRLPSESPRYSTFQRGDSIYVPEVVLSEVLSYITSFSPSASPSHQSLPHPCTFEIEWVEPTTVPPGRKVYARVIMDEPSQERNSIIVPDWIFNNLGCSSESLVTLRQVVLEKACLINLRPLNPSFNLHFPDPLFAIQSGLESGCRGVVARGGIWSIHIPSSGTPSSGTSYLFLVKDVKVEGGGGERVTCHVATLFDGSSQLSSIDLMLDESLEEGWEGGEGAGESTSSSSSSSSAMGGGGRGSRRSSDASRGYKSVLEHGVQWPGGDHNEEGAHLGEGTSRQYSLTTFIAPGCGLRICVNGGTGNPPSLPAPTGTNMSSPILPPPQPPAASGLPPMSPQPLSLLRGTRAPTLPEVFASLHVTNPSPQRFDWCFLSKGLEVNGTLEKVCIIQPLVQATGEGQVATTKVPIYITFSLSPGTPSTNFSCVVEETPPSSSALEGGGGGGGGGAPFSPPPQDTTICSHCKHSIPAASKALHEVQCARNNWVCTTCGVVLPKRYSHTHSHCTAAAECGFIGDAEEVARHTAIVHTPSPCHLCGTGLFIPGPVFEGHITSECSRRRVGCRYCKSGNITAGDLVAHEAKCGSLSTPCPNCGQRVTAFAQALHDETECREGGVGGGGGGRAGGDGGGGGVWGTGWGGGRGYQPPVRDDPPTPPPDLEDVSRIVMMGFDPEDAMRGLKKFPGNVRAAVEFVLNNPISPPSSE